MKAFRMLGYKRRSATYGDYNMQIQREKDTGICIVWDFGDHDGIMQVGRGASEPTDVADGGGSPVLTTTPEIL